MWIAEVEKCYHTQLLIYYRKSRHSSEAVFVYTVYSDIFIVRFLFFHNMSEGNTQGCKLRVSPWYNIISVFGQRHDICRFDTEACDRHEMTSSAHLTQLHLYQLTQIRFDSFITEIFSGNNILSMVSRHLNENQFVLKTIESMYQFESIFLLQYCYLQHLYYE